ncbi:hypothetical protein SASPL_111421 [Salvia splendens]|uniref:Golgin candidate 4 n=1 Tax=Salvia splendens TaxID=180675 RepID=A0A8X9A4A8_SALSN|nr:hypothetical protein SASPL_111421 [Salvia splendens]
MPMWSSVANLKESLSKIALDVHDDDDDEELSMYTSPPRDQSDNASSGSERRVSRNSSAPTHSPIINGFDSPPNHEIELYKTKIKKLQESESEIKALSVNYAALLKEKEDQILRLTEENGSLKQNLLSTNAAHGAPKTILKGNGDMSLSRFSKSATKNRGAGSTLSNGVVTKHDGLSNGTSTSSRELSDAMEEKIRSFTMMQATHESQMKQMMVELDKERRKLESVQLSLQEEQRLNGSFQHDLSSLKDEKYKGLLEKEEMQKSLHKLENDLKQACMQKDKALQELNRLKQHLLDKESEESEKMDEDSKIIEELRGIIDQQKVQISHLENALKQAISRQEEVKMSNNSEHAKAKEVIDDLKRKLSNCYSTIDAKNMEVLNLQTALGQYYAEIEAKERLAKELSVTKEESARLIKQLQEAHQLAEASKRAEKELLGKLSQADIVVAEGKNRVKKLEEDNEKLRRALEQSMTRLNRMSVDSDFLVDRRIVIKLLVTYFQRNHSKERIKLLSLNVNVHLIDLLQVLDLMCRMLGFSDEEKQRIGVAQLGPGKGVVRGVLGLPGRLVGGILGGGAPEAHSAMASDDQSFADLWVDFLLTETEREKREAANNSNPDQNSTETTSPYVKTLPQGNFLRREPSDSEFSTVPLTSSESSLQGSRLPPKY